MGWISDVANNGIDASAAQAWVNQKKEEEWAAAKEEERRQDRVNERESYSYDPAPAPAPKIEAIDKAKEAAKAQSQSLKETVTGSKGDTGSSSAEGAKGFAEKISYQPAETPAPAPEPEPEPITEPEPEPTPAPAPTQATESEPQVYSPAPAEEAVATAERRTEKQGNAVASYVEDEAEKSSGQNGWSASRSKGEPVVYTGGTAGTIGMKRSATQIIAAQTKNEITGEDDNATILQKYWAMSPEEQAAQVGNPRVQAALRAQAAAQIQANQGNGAGVQPVTPQPSGLHYMGAGPAEPGTMNFATHMGPELVKDGRFITMPAKDYYQQQAMERYLANYDPLRAAIVRAEYGRGGSGMETRGYDPGIRLANDQQYLADNGFSWSGNPSMQSAERGDTYVPGAEMTPTEAMRHQPGYSNVPLSLPDPEVVNRNEPGYTAPNETQMQQAIEALNRQGIYGEEALRQAQEMVASINNTRERLDNWLNPGNEVTADMVSMSPAEEMRHRPGYSYVPKVPATTPAASTATPPTTGGQSTGNGRPGADAALNDVMNGNGYRWVPDSVRLAQERGTRTAQYLADQAAARSGQGTTGTSENGSQAGSESSAKAGLKTGNKYGSSNVADKVKEIMDMALKLKPTYGQGGQVVKAPYRKGGYTMEELEKMGNAPRTDFKYDNGKTAYEGYYLAPDGNYYPIDQIKANYYVSHGNSYRGWEEPMREYYNNFGTFFGYRPDWKTAGGVNVWKQNRPASGRSYGGGGSGSAPVVNNQQRLRLSGYTGGSGGTNYGRGSTANNGIYYNPNTSWSI